MVEVSDRLVEAAILHLHAIAPLPEADRALLAAVLGRTVRTFGPRHDIALEGDAPHAVRVVLDGWACRYKQLPDGRRQILAFFVPGDLCDSGVFLLDRMDHSIAAITEVRLAEISPPEFARLTREARGLAQALALHELVTVAIQREWTLGLGQRSAVERVAHLLCELYLRLEAVGRTSGSGCEFPLTQNHIASATGLTPVHVNRVLGTLRQHGWIALARRRLILRDRGALQAAAMFDPVYLHLRPPCSVPALQAASGL